MILAELCVATLLLGVCAYAVLGGADFGAGFWDLTAGGAERGARLRGLVKLAMGPVWEANHVWLIFTLVVFWTGFPTAFASVMQTMYIPLFVVAVGIIFRGTAFAVRGEAATIAEARVLGATFALSSVLIPFFLGAVIGGVASGRVPVLPETGEVVGAWLNPTSALIGTLGVAAGAYVSAVFLAGDARRNQLDDLVAAFRIRALGAALVAGAIALGGLLVVRADAPDLYAGLTSGLGLACVLASAAAGAVTIALVWRWRFEPARYSSAAAVLAVVVGWAVAQRPDFLPGALSFAEAAAPEPTLVALLISVAIAVVILGPALVLLFRLTLSGRLDTEFHPITAADSPPQGER